MMSKTKFRLLFVLGIIVAGFALLNILAYRHAYAMMHFSSAGQQTGKPEGLSLAAKLKVLLSGVNVPRPVNQHAPAELDAACQALSFGGADGITLSAWYCNRGPASPLVILFHGYTGEKTSLIPEAKAFLELGASVLLVDFRGSGGSSENYTTIGVREADDVAAAFQFSHAKLSHSATVLFGQSMGAAAILRAIHEAHITPDAIILEAVFDTMLNTVRNRFSTMELPSFPSAQLLVFWGGRQWDFNGFAHNPVEYARSVKCPALFLHGYQDPRATLAEGRRVFMAVSGPKEFREFKTAGHEAYILLQPAEWRAAVMQPLNAVAPNSTQAKTSP